MTYYEKTILISILRGIFRYITHHKTISSKEVNDIGRGIDDLEKAMTKKLNYHRYCSQE